MADEWLRTTGVQVSRTAIAMALKRLDIPSAHPRPRYEDLLPWRVKVEHRQVSDARLLRLEGRRRQGLPLTDAELEWLTGWKQRLLEANAVIHYDPRTVEGFHWVVRDADDDDLIRRPRE